MFTESDWKGIQEPGNSIKRSDPNTVGRFGLGFNSVYHITDYPAIFSGKNIGILDPQEKVFRRGGRLWNLEENKQCIEELTDQFHPFQDVLEAIGRGSWNEILNVGCFNGTLFRFPLRLIPSGISDNLYSSERVQELFESFIRDASISLLFLRHVTTVSLKSIGNDGVVNHLLTISVSTEDKKEEVSSSFIKGTCVKVTSLKGFDREEEVSKWLVTTSSVHGNLFPDLMELSKKLCNKPALDLAYPLTKQGIDSFGGRLSCFLPLPDKEENRTGLPVLINGSFDLTDDRRSMKWLEVDQQHDEAAKWNHILVEKLLPLVYMCAVNDAVSLAKVSKITAEVAYGIWPDPDRTVHKGRWHNLTKDMAQSLLKEKILYVAANSLWIEASEAVFLKSIDDNDLLNCLEELLLLLRQPLVKVPGHVYRTLALAENSIGGLNEVCPSFIRKILHNDDWSPFPQEKKMLLLGYVLHDGLYNDLLNLQLLPLSDGTFTSFQNTDENGMAYLDSQDFPRILLPGLAQRFLPKDLADGILSHLRNIGSKRVFKNLVCLDEDVISRKLCEALPKTWLSCDDRVTWHPGDPSNPPIEWLETFWIFLQRHDNILYAFESHPLVPLNWITEDSTSIQLARLKNKPTLLFQKRDGHCLTDCIAKILEQVGCTVIRQWNKWLCHKTLLKYILLPTPNNVLKTFSHLNLKQIIQAFTDMPEECMKLFCDFLAQAFSFSAQELQIIYQLPIFSSARSIGFSNSDSRLVAALHSRAVERNTVPAVPENLVFPDILLKCRDESDHRLLQHMKITSLKATDVALLLVRAIHNGSYARYHQEAQNAMLWILRNGTTLFYQNKALTDVCKNLNFIPCNGKLLQPSVLFDPDINIFKALFETERFPPASYNEPSVLTSLRTLGLKDSVERITSDDILQIAEKVSQERNHVSSMKKAEALIKVCNNTTVLSQLNSHNVKKLCSFAWVPINSNCLSVFSEPQKLRSMRYSNIVEFSMPLTNDFNELASKRLGLNDPPPTEKVVENLNSLSEKYQKLDTVSLLMKLHNIYKYIQDNIVQFHGGLSNVMIWNGEGFSDPSEIVLFYPEDLDLSCNVKKVPHEFLIHKSLFMKCGVRNSLSENEVTEIIYTLQRKMELRCSDVGTHKERKLAISILDWMKANSVHGTDDLPIPVQAGSNEFSLKPLSTALFCDMDKQHLNDISARSTDYHIVHEDISWATARFLNIHLLSTRVLKPEFFEPWGPSEPVTLRIKNILREYSEHVELFKELIQNADDADATVCDFLVDMRQNLESRQSLIDPDMTSCHGPALWSYNNSNFTDIDFINITRIGAATKETQVEKIGKFGLGFNTVYHITDVPSIMSGTKVIIFDPNVNHIKKHIPNGTNPGIKLNLQEHCEVLQIFADQFRPYSNVFGCELKQPFYYEGTLIRLPFRTEQEAKDSKICKQAFSEEQINSFINSFEESTDVLIIFLKSVQKVTLSFLPPKALNPKNKTVSVDLQRDRVQRLEVPKSCNLQQEQMNAAKMLGMHTNSLDITVSNIIKITVQQMLSVNEKYYLVHSSLGIQESFQMFKLNQNKKTRFSLPVAGIALPLKKNQDSGKWAPDLMDFNGTVFCFLPLPISSGLPFHLNGSFSVMSNRKSLWDITEKGVWNKNLLCDAVLVALLTALSQLQVLSQHGDIQEYCYHTFWPDITKVKTQFTGAVEAFYKAVTFGLGDCFPVLFSNGQECCTIKHACFLQLDNIQNEKVHSLAKKVFTLVLKKPYLAVSLPDWVKNSFHTSCCGKELLCNTYNWERFYREIVFENLDSLDTEDRNALILHAIDMQSKEVNNLLKSKPCIPSTPHGKLQYIGKLVHPSGKVSTLYDQEEGHFPQGGDFLKPEILARLQILGMTKDKLPIKELMARAHTINDVWKHDRSKGLKRIVYVLALLNDLLDQYPNDTCQEEFRNIAFLPAVSPQSRLGGLKDLLLMKSTDLYHYKHKDLVYLIEPVLSKEHVGQNFKFSENMLSILDLDRIPPPEKVLFQLQKAHNISNLLSAKELSQTVRKCYTYLNKLIQKERNRGANIRCQASSFPFIYIGREFVKLNFVARNMSVDASPYLYQLPKEYVEFDKLWDCVGLCEEFSTGDYISVLQKIDRKHKGNHLPQNDLLIAVNLINLISNGVSVDLLDVQQILVPDQQCILHHVDKIYFNDTPWLPCDDDLNFCHEMIPRAVVLKLGIKTKIHQTLQKLKVSNLSCWVSSFGAKEDLTRRIKNIISEYSSKKDILKELIQNADDAEATEIHFVLDSRTHPTTCTFGEEWHSQQGPALCIYNNKKFESSDIAGIQSLGQGGKGDRLDKTGKYGLGFNSVYHLTDCPSFVTGDTMLCIFDPNCKFLPTSDDNSPGGMYNVNNKFKGTFKDVYNTFLPNFCNLSEGTLFRLPLRTAKTVAISKICDQTVSLKDIRDLCMELKQDAANMTLFLNSVGKITFSEISDTNDLVKVLSIETKINSLYVNDRSAFQEKLSQLAENDKHMSETEPFRVFYTMEIKCSSSEKPMHWFVAKQIGIEGQDQLTNLKRICGSLHQTCIPHGAVAACLSDPPNGRAFCTLPLPVETGLPVHISGSFIVDAARRDICKEDGGSPKTEWNTFLLSNVIAPLYCNLLGHIFEEITKDRETPLTFKNVDSCILFLESTFLKHFPLISKSMSPQWQKMVGQVYLTIYQKHLKLIPVYRMKSIQGKFSSTQIVVVQSSVTEEPYFFHHADYTQLEHVLHSINMKLVVPCRALYSIYAEFKRAEVKVLKLSPETLRNFLRHVQLHPQGYALPIPVGESLLRTESNCKLLLESCLQGPNTEKVIDLEGVPLLVTEDGMLRHFSLDEPRYYTHFYELFQAYSDKFAKLKVVSILFHVLVKSGFLQTLPIQKAAVYIKEQMGQMSLVKNENCATLTNENKEWLKTLWEFFFSELKRITEKQSRIKLFEEIIALFGDLAILPVSYAKRPREICLLPLVRLKNILYRSSSEVAQYLFKLGFAKLESSLLPVHMTIDYIEPHLFNTEDWCLVLEHLCSKNDLYWEELDQFEMDIFLKFFLRGLANFSKNKDFIYKLQSLPLFETHHGKRQHLNVYQNKYILNTLIDLQSRKLFELNSQIVFLKNNELNKELSKYMNIPVINDLDFLIQFLLPHMASLCENEILEVLLLVLKIQDLDRTEFDNKKEVIITALKPLQIIKDRQGVFRQPSYFYDHTVKLFSTFELQSRFIPDELKNHFEKRKSYFHQLLLDLGVKQKLSEDDFIHFATRIEREAKGTCSLKLLVPKIEELFDYLLCMKEKEMTNNFTKKVGNIKFLIPIDVKNDLKSLHPSYTKNTSLIALKESLLKQRGEYELLVWTSMALLKTKHEPDPKQLRILTKCGVLCKPPVDLVVENVKNVCGAPCECKDLLKIRSQVLQVTYNFLQIEDTFDTSSLDGVPFILVDDDAVAEPEQVVFNLQHGDSFRPYLYKLPPLLACFSLFFQKAGVEAEATVFHYAKVLSTIYEETLQKTSLHRNLKRTVSQATQQLFTLLDEKKQKDLQKLKPLYLPATDGKLHDSCNLVLNNCCSFMATDKLNDIFKFFSFECTNNSFLHKSFDLYQQETLIKCLPVDIRPKILSQITKETINVRSEDFCTYGENCELKSRLQELLGSPKFHEGLICLLRSQSNGELAEEEASQKCNAVFGKLEIICCHKLRTILKYNDKQLEGTNSSKEVFVTKGSESQCQIYLKHYVIMLLRNAVNIAGTLADQINNILENVFIPSSIPILMEMLSCKDPDEIADVLKAHRIWKKKNPNHHAFSLANPGEPIPNEWYDSLDMSSINSFKVGDYVGYMDPSEEGVYVYAIIVEELNSKIIGSCEIQMYRIRLGQGKTADVSIHDLYQFKRSVAQKSKELVLVENLREQEEIHEKWYEMSIADTKKEIDEYLSKIWALPKEERNKVIRRLYLKYHPDKNIGQEKLSTEICKYLQQKIMDLEAGRNFSSKNCSSKHSDPFRSYSTFWGRWDSEASSHRQNREHFSKTTKCDYDFWGYHSRHTKPNPDEAQRWFRQAECDLRAAKNDVDHHHTEWVFYKVHQAIEKALFSAQYIKHGKIDNNDSIRSLASKVSMYCSSLRSVTDQVLQMERHGVDKLKTQYPKYHTPPGIPNDSIPADKEHEVIALAENVLKKIETYVYN
ncbi:hypothetical protein FKM82_013475 [Ascaphus truei]